MVYVNMANALKALGDNSGAVALYDQAIRSGSGWSIRKAAGNWLMTWRGITQTRPTRSGLLAKIARVCCCTINPSRSWKSWSIQEGAENWPMIWRQLTRTRPTWSAIWGHRGVVVLYDRAIAILERLVIRKAAVNWPEIWRG